MSSFIHITNNSLRIALVSMLMLFSYAGFSQSHHGTISRKPNTARHQQNKPKNNATKTKRQNRNNNNGVTHSYASTTPPTIEELILFVRNSNKGVGTYLKQRGYKDMGWFHATNLGSQYGSQKYCHNCSVDKSGYPIRYQSNSSIIESGSVGFGPCITITLFSKERTDDIYFQLLKSGYKADNNSDYSSDNMDNSTSLVNGNIAVDFSVIDQKYYITIRRNI